MASRCPLQPQPFCLCIKPSSPAKARTEGKGPYKMLVISLGVGTAPGAGLTQGSQGKVCYSDRARGVHTGDDSLQRQ